MKTSRFFVRLFLVICGAVLMAININTFVYTASLLPGGFTGVVLLIQEIFMKFFVIDLPFSIFYYILNAIPAIFCFKLVGRNFTLYSILMIILSGFLTDLFPGFHVTGDVLLCTIFGGLLNGLAISLCLFADATSGGTDFISIIVSQKTGKSAWNYIFMGNCCVLAIAGFLFGWDHALYSIIFQFTQTQVLNLLYKRYQKITLLVITDKNDEVYQMIKETTNHDATLFIGTGCYKGAERRMLYTVVSGDQAVKLSTRIKKIDEHAFINVLQSKDLLGNFFMREND